jgi:hypothetical protein
MSCTQNYTMMQLAALSSVAVLSTIMFGSFGGQLIEPLGWTNFWMLTILANIPALLLMTRAPKNL